MKLLLFDFDGVIVDTFRISYEISNEIIPGGIDIDTYRGFFNGNIFDAGDTTDSKTVTAEEPFFNKYVPRMLDEVPVDGMIDVLKNLHEQGNRLVIVSSTINSPIEMYLTKHGIRHLFDRVYGVDVHKNKTKKIKMALDEFKRNPDESIFITDTLGDIHEAAKAGVRSIAVTWGFQEKASLDTGKPMKIVSTPKELLRALEE